MGQGQVGACSTECSVPGLADSVGWTYPQQTGAEHAAQKILHRQLNAAVNQWQWLLHRARRARWVRTKALAQWINRHTGRAFHTWATKVANSKMTSECSSCAELKERIVVLEEIVKVQASKLTASEQQLADELAAMQRLSIQCQAVAMQSWCQP